MPAKESGTASRDLKPRVPRQCSEAAVRGRGNGPVVSGRLVNSPTGGGGLMLARDQFDPLRENRGDRSSRWTSWGVLPETAAAFTTGVGNGRKPDCVGHIGRRIR